MLSRSFYQTAFVFGLTLSSAFLLPACGAKQAEVKTADHVQPGAMPEGGEWRGVYYNPVFGFLHVTTEGNALQGAWETEAGDKWGELYGEIDGDLVKFGWIERTKGVVGPAAKSEGKGYFRYTIPKPGQPHELKGEWGLNENEVGHSWDCVKQTNMEPDPKSVRPDEMESRVGAVGFDGAKGDSNVLGGPEEEKKKEGEKKEGEGQEGEGQEGEGQEGAE